MGKEAADSKKNTTRVFKKTQPVRYVSHSTFLNLHELSEQYD